MGSHARKTDHDAEFALVASLRDGDLGALETLMIRYGDRVFRLAHGICRNEAYAEEVAQDVFLTVFRKIDSFEGKSALWTWLFRVTTNAALISRRPTSSPGKSARSSTAPSTRSRRTIGPSSSCAMWRGSRTRRSLTRSARRSRA